MRDLGLQKAYLWKRWADILHLKSYKITETCSCSISLSFAHLPPMAIPIDEKLYLWNRRTDFLRSSLELSWPIVVQCQGHLSTGVTMAKNRSSETAAHSSLWMYLWTKTFVFETTELIIFVRSSIELSRPVVANSSTWAYVDVEEFTVVVQRHGHLRIRSLWACSWVKNFIAKLLDEFFPY